MSHTEYLMAIAAGGITMILCDGSLIWGLVGFGVTLALLYITNWDL